MKHVNTQEILICKECVVMKGVRANRSSSRAGVDPFQRLQNAALYSRHEEAGSRTMKQRSYYTYMVILVETK